MARPAARAQSIKALAAETGFFGKVASQGDFVVHRVERGLREMLDRWLQKALDQEQRTRGAAWKQSFLHMPPWRFVLGSESGSQVPVVGVMVPSRDRVGRTFPLFLLARLPNYRGPTRALCGERIWFEAAERLLLAATKKGNDLAELDKQLSELPELGSTRQNYRDLAPEAERSFWWTEERRIESRRFAANGMPAPDSFGRFLGSDDTLADPVTPVQPPKSRPVAPLGVARQPSPPFQSAQASHAGTRLAINTHRLSSPELTHLHAIAHPHGGDGAHAAYAAELVIERLTRIEDGDLNDMVSATKGALGSANTLLRSSSVATEPPRISVLVLLLSAEGLAVVWAGDIRLYLLRDGLMRPLTRDHVEVGMRRRLSRSVGGAAQFACDVFTEHLQAGDRFLLVTHSLIRIVPERSIAEQLSTLPIEHVPEALVQDALIAGAPENVSVVAVAFGKPA